MYFNCFLYFLQIHYLILGPILQKDLLLLWKGWIIVRIQEKELVGATNVYFNKKWLHWIVIGGLSLNWLELGSILTFEQVTHCKMDSYFSVLTGASIAS